MKRSFRLGVAFGLLFASAVTLSAQYRVSSKFGRKQVNGRNLIVHVTVAAPIGVPAETIADRELGNRGAAPMSSAPFVAIGPVWEDSTDGVEPGADNLVQTYNAAGGGGAIADPTGIGGQAYTRGQDAWTEVSTSRFAFVDSGPTGRCPSLVEACDGDQIADGHNDVGWCYLGALSPIFGGTLGVTWFEWDDATNAMIEADVCMNGDPTVTWADGSDFDVQTVMTHELGHVATLGHSRNRRAVMYASYLGVRRELHGDDVNGISALYPIDDGGEDPTNSCVIPNGLPAGSSCTNDADCCSAKCRGPRSGKSCKP